MIPTDSIVLKIDKEAVLRSGMTIPKALNGEIPDYMHISLKGKRLLYKNELMMLEMLANANWERPIYMAITVGKESQLNLGRNFIQEGLASRISPFNTVELGGAIDAEKMYDNLMNRFTFGGMDTPGIYLDETIMRMAYTHRRLFVMLANELIDRGETDKALAVLDRSEQELPASNLPHDYYMCYSHSIALAYIQLGQKEKGLDILRQIADKEVEYATWYLSLSDRKFRVNAETCRDNIQTLYRIVGYMELAKDEEVLNTYTAVLNDLYAAYNARLKG